MTDILVRPVHHNNYEAMADLINSTNPLFPTSAEALREGDLRRPTYCKVARWVVKEGENLIGLGMFVQYADSYDPHIVHPRIWVHPQYEGCGIGRALNAEIEQEAFALGMTLLRSAVNEDQKRALKFALHAGYEEYKRRLESELNLTTFDPTPFASLRTELAATGIQIRTYREMADTPNRDRLLYKLQMSTEVDVPNPFPFTPPSFEEYGADMLDHPSIPDDGILVAIADNEWVGMTMHYHVSAEHINVEYSGVQRRFRGRGIALALKVDGALYAQSCGAKILSTTNDPDNPAILTVNQKLGFAPRPALLLIRKAISS